MMNKDWFMLLCTAVVTFCFVIVLMRPLIVWLQRCEVWDIPNERSSHNAITPRGGGIAVIAGIVLGSTIWLWLWQELAHGALLLLFGVVLLAIVSWIDDRRGGLSIGIRLASQFFCCALVLVLMPSHWVLAGGVVPVWLERALLLFVWIWFTNLFNFMDGINGITSVEVISVGVGITLVTNEPKSIGGLGLVVVAAAIGFAPSNWGRAKVFLGDVGSIPMGYFLGGLLVLLSFQGQWTAALILPMYYWVDATVTLLRRLLRGEKVWQAHRSHFYQQGARKFGSHTAVSTRIAGLNLLLIGLALLSLQSWLLAIVAVVAAVLASAALCGHFAEAPERLG